MQKTTSINFWNGNRSAPRQVYEREVLHAVLEATKKTWGNYEVNENLEDYPGKMESLAFSVKNDARHSKNLDRCGNFQTQQLQCP